MLEDVVWNPEGKAIENRVCFDNQRIWLIKLVYPIQDRLCLLGVPCLDLAVIYTIRWLKKTREYIFKKEAEQLGHHVTWFTQTYSGDSYTPILIHPSARLAYDAYVPEGSKVIQKDSLQRIVESVRDFVAVLAAKPASQWAAPDVASQLATYELRPNDFLNKVLLKNVSK